MPEDYSAIEKELDAERDAADIPYGYIAYWWRRKAVVLKSELDKAAPYKVLCQKAAAVLLQHMNDEEYEMSLAGVYAMLTADEDAPAAAPATERHP